MTPFEEAGRAGRIVQDSQFLRVFDMIFHIVGGERTGIFLAKIFVDAIAYGAYLLILQSIMEKLSSVMNSLTSGIIFSFMFSQLLEPASTAFAPEWLTM